MVLRHDEGLSHRVYAGADMILIPSAFEPCGLTQLISLRYGTVPIVRETGGLVDTVSADTSAGGREGHVTGFKGDRRRRARGHCECVTSRECATDCQRRSLLVTGGLERLRRRD
jgi:glycogen synthase